MLFLGRAIAGQAEAVAQDILPLAVTAVLVVVAAALRLTEPPWALEILAVLIQQEMQPWVGPVSGQTYPVVMVGQIQVAVVAVEHTTTQTIKAVMADLV
jgi:hypothetical protein